MYEALVDFTSELFVSRVDKIKWARRGYRIVFNRELANHVICSLEKKPVSEPLGQASSKGNFP